MRRLLLVCALFGAPATTRGDLIFNLPGTLNVQGGLTAQQIDMSLDAAATATGFDLMVNAPVASRVADIAIMLPGVNLPLAYAGGDLSNVALDYDRNGDGFGQFSVLLSFGGAQTQVQAGTSALLHFLGSGGLGVDETAAGSLFNAQGFQVAVHVVPLDGSNPS